VLAVRRQDCWVEQSKGRNAPFVRVPKKNINNE